MVDVVKYMVVIRVPEIRVRVRVGVEVRVRVGVRPA